MIRVRELKMGGQEGCMRVLGYGCGEEGGESLLRLFEGQEKFLCCRSMGGKGQYRLSGHRCLGGRWNGRPVMG